MQVPGSPFVGWVKVSVRDGATGADFFHIERGQTVSHDPP
jgi:hypothetical protein